MRRKIFVALLVLLLVFAGAACGGPVSAPEVDPGAVLHSIGQGEVVFSFLVTGPDEAVSGWDVRTDEETVGAALLALGLIAGDAGQFGLMVTEVNGIVADWDVNGSFWAFFIDGDFAMTGVDATYIEPGVTYAFVYTRG